MVIYLNLDDSNYVTGHGTDDGDVKIDIDKEHEFFKTDIHAWQYVDGELIFDEERNKKITQEREIEEQKISKEERNEMAMLELANLVAELKGEL